MEEEARKSKEIMEEERREKELKKELMPYVVKEVEEKIKREGVDEEEIKNMIELHLLSLSREEAISIWKQDLIDMVFWRLKYEKKEIEGKFFTVTEAEEAISAWKQKLLEKYKKSESEDKEK